MVPVEEPDRNRSASGLTVPAQQRLRRNQEHRPAPPREQPGGGGQQHPIPPPQRRPLHRPPQHRQLMPQHSPTPALQPTSRRRTLSAASERPGASERKAPEDRTDRSASPRIRISA